MKLPTDLIQLVCEYVPKMVLLDWITPDMLNKKILRNNVNAVDLIHDCKQPTETKEMFMKKVKFLKKMVKEKHNQYLKVKANVNDREKIDAELINNCLDEINWDVMYNHPVFKKVFNIFAKIKLGPNGVSFMYEDDRDSFEITLYDVCLNEYDSTVIYGVNYTYDMSDTFAIAYIEQLFRIYDIGCSMDNFLKKYYLEIINGQIENWDDDHMIYINLRPDLFSYMGKSLIDANALSANPHIFKPVFNAELQKIMIKIMN